MNLPLPRATLPHRILVVDDEPTVCDLIQSILQRDGFRVTLATSGRQALELFQESAFDLVITDYLMPGITGDQLATALKAVVPQQPVLLLTGYGQQLRSSRELLPAVDAILTKPFDIEELRQTVGRLLACAIVIPDATAKSEIPRRQLPS